MTKKRVILSSRKKQQYTFYAEMIEFFRCNPVIACEMLLGVPLTDSQAWVLQQSWNSSDIMWTCTRGWGKSFMIAVFVMLKALLYPDMRIYIVSRTGEQSKETFTKIEQLALKGIASIQSLTDIFIDEVVIHKNSNGFLHDPAGYKCTLYNNSTIQTINSKPDNARGKRADLLVYDESSFIPEDLLEATKPFLSEDADFVLSTDESFNQEAQYKKVPNQVLYASSAGDETSTHAKLYKQYSKMMVAGIGSVFCCDIQVDEPLNPTRQGEKIRSRMSRSTYENAMRTNPVKALREYHNRFDADGGEDQLIKSSIIRRNETFTLPQVESHNKNEKFAIAFDPAHSNDNSIITVMKIKHDKEIGYYGEIINCMNMVDLNKEKQMNYRFTDQTRIVRDALVRYSSGAKLDYEGIEVLLIDAGAGGHGTSYASELLEEWTSEEDGITRKGVIDRTHEQFKNESGFMENKNILRLINPRNKQKMVDELLILMKSDLIKFPLEYSGSSTITTEVEVGKGETMLKEVPLSVDERIALVNIDLLKTEATSMYRYGNSIEVSRERRCSVGDDRFDTLVMLGHYLYQLRSKHQVKKSKRTYDLKDYLII